jgi:hypothetical protein
VTSASELDVRDAGLAAYRVRADVVELHEGALAAAAAVRPHERATPEVAYPYGPLDRRGDMTRARRPDATRSGPRSTGRARLLLCPELLPRQVREQGDQGAVEDGLVVARGQRVSQHILGESQLLQRRAADRQLVPVAIG